MARLGLGYDDERRRIREEMIDEQIFAKEQQALGSMKLSELLSVDPGKSITEPPGAAGGEAGGRLRPGGGLRHRVLARGRPLGHGQQLPGGLEAEGDVLQDAGDQLQGGHVV